MVKKEREQGSGSVELGPTRTIYKTRSGRNSRQPYRYVDVPSDEDASVGLRIVAPFCDDYVGSADERTLTLSEEEEMYGGDDEGSSLDEFVASDNESVEAEDEDSESDASATSDESEVSSDSSSSSDESETENESSSENDSTDTDSEGGGGGVFRGLNPPCA